MSSLDFLKLYGFSELYSGCLAWIIRTWTSVKTRKFSCVNARGILPAVYQVLPLLSYPWGERGVILSLAGGIPHPWVGGTPSLAGGYPSLGLGSPSWATLWGGTWDQSLGYPSGKDMGPVEVLWYGDGVPPPLPPRCELTNKLKLLPSPSFGCRW